MLAPSWLGTLSSSRLKGSAPLLDVPEVIGGLMQEPGSALLPNAISKRTAIWGAEPHFGTGL